MIEIDSLHRRFGSVHALRGLTFTVGPTGVWGLLGPNGAGKSTSLRILAGALAPDSGRVRVGGLDPSARGARARLGALTQRTPLADDLTVTEYLRFRCALAGVSVAERQQSIARELDRCELSSVANRLCGALSSGFRQRAGLAATLVHGPAVVLLDEPSAGLDPLQAPRFRELIRGIGRERLVLVSSHALAEVEAMCDGAVLIDQGRTVACGTIGELRARGADDASWVIEWRGAEPSPPAGWRIVARESLEDGWSRARVQTASAGEANDIASIVSGADRWVRRVERESDGLESVFARLIGGPR